MKKIYVNLEVVETSMSHSSYPERRETIVFSLEDLAEHFCMSPGYLLDSILEARDFKNKRKEK